MKSLMKGWVSVIVLMCSIPLFAHENQRRERMVEGAKIDVVIEDGTRLPDGPNGQMQWNLYDEKGRIIGHSEYTLLANTVECFQPGHCQANVNVKYVFDNGKMVTFNNAKFSMTVLGNDMANFMGIGSVHPGGNAMIFNVIHATGMWEGRPVELFYRSQHEGVYSGNLNDFANFNLGLLDFLNCIRCLGVLITT